jgi:hypothetical protein
VEPREQDRSGVLPFAREQLRQNDAHAWTGENHPRLA